MTRYGGWRSELDNFHKAARGSISVNQQITTWPLQWPHCFDDFMSVRVVIEIWSIRNIFSASSYNNLFSLHKELYCRYPKLINIDSSSVSFSFYLVDIFHICWEHRWLTWLFLSFCASEKSVNIKVLISLIETLWDTLRCNQSDWTILTVNQRTSKGHGLQHPYDDDGSDTSLYV